MDQAALDQMKERVRKELDEAIKEFGDVVDEVAKDYAQLSADSQQNGPKAAVELVVDLLMEHVKLPMYIPAAAVKAALSAALIKIIEERMKARAAGSPG